MTSIAFRGNTAIIRRKFSSLLTKASASSTGNHFLGGYAPPVSAQTPILRTFSQAPNFRTKNNTYSAQKNSASRNFMPAAETTFSDDTNNSSPGTFSTTELGTITTPLKKLDKNTVRKIEAELHEVDVDHDGR